MIFIALDAEGCAVDWTTDCKSFAPGTAYISRWDFVSFDHVTHLAEQLTTLGGGLFLPVDNGEGCSPRFDVIKAPLVGDVVSMGFNGDYCPVGKITSISSDHRVITATGSRKFYRKQLTGVWKYANTWTLIGGTRLGADPSI